MIFGYIEFYEVKYLKSLYRTYQLSKYVSQNICVNIYCFDVYNKHINIYSNICIVDIYNLCHQTSKFYVKPSLKVWFVLCY